eukprot:5804113-Prymnesium_polylepis.1
MIRSQISYANIAQSSTALVYSINETQPAGHLLCGAPTTLSIFVCRVTVVEGLSQAMERHGQGAAKLFQRLFPSVVVFVRVFCFEFLCTPPSISVVCPAVIVLGIGIASCVTFRRCEAYIRTLPRHKPGLLRFGARVPGRLESLD